MLTFKSMDTHTITHITTKTKTSCQYVSNEDSCTKEVRWDLSMLQRECITAFVMTQQTHQDLLFLNLLTTTQSKGPGCCCCHLVYQQCVTLPLIMHIYIHNSPLTLIPLPLEVACWPVCTLVTTVSWALVWTPLLQCIRLNVSSSWPVCWQKHDHQAVIWHVF